MLEWIDIRPEVTVAPSEYQRLLGYPAGHELSDRARDLAAEAEEWYAANGQPWIYARKVEQVAWSDTALRLGDASFESRVLRDQFETGGAHDAVLVAVSAGSQCEERARQLWQEGKPDEYFFL